MVIKQGAFAPVLFTGLMLAGPASAAVLYSENFRSPTMPGEDGVTPCNTGPGGPGTYLFPVGWLLRNVDNRTPAASVAYVNEAWEVREDFALDVTNCVAFATSWYSPAGAANDFMWSPAIAIPAGGASLSWRARSYDALYLDGYEVRVMPAASGPPTGGTGAIGNQITASTVVFSTTAEPAGNVWHPRSVSLNAFNGQSVHVGFRATSTDKFILVVDDVKVISVDPDLVAQTPPAILPYTRVPTALAYQPSLGVTAFNAGAVPLNNITGTAQLLRNGVAVGAAVAATPVVGPIAVGANAPVTFAGSTDAIAGPGVWTVRYQLLANETETGDSLLNNTIDSASVEVNTTELARHEGVFNGTLGIGANNGGELGVQFTLPNSAAFEGLRFHMADKPEMVDDGVGGTRPSQWAGLPLIANLRDFDTINNKPGSTVIASTVAGVSSFAGGIYDLPFATGPQTLAAGTYVVTVVEPQSPGNEDTIPLSMHTSRFQTGTVWVNWPTAPAGDWTNTETFGPTFAKTPAVSMLVQIAMFKDGFEEVPPGRVVEQADTVVPKDADRRNSGKMLKLADPSTH